MTVRSSLEVIRRVFLYTLHNWYLNVMGRVLPLHRQISTGGRKPDAQRDKNCIIILSTFVREARCIYQENSWQSSIVISSPPNSAIFLTHLL